MPYKDHDLETIPNPSGKCDRCGSTSVLADDVTIHPRHWTCSRCGALFEKEGQKQLSDFS